MSNRFAAVGRRGQESGQHIPDDLAGWRVGEQSGDGDDLGRRAGPCADRDTQGTRGESGGFENRQIDSRLIRRPTAG
jgi:hypothetical protein